MMPPWVPGTWSDSRQKYEWRTRLLVLFLLKFILLLASRRWSWLKSISFLTSEQWNWVKVMKLNYKKRMERTDHWSVKLFKSEVLNTSIVVALESGLLRLHLILNITEKFFQFLIHHKNNWSQKWKAMSIDWMTSEMKRKNMTLIMAAADSNGCTICEIFICTYRSE